MYNQIIDEAEILYFGKRNLVFHKPKNNQFVKYNTKDNKPNKDLRKEENIKIPHSVNKLINDIFAVAELKHKNKKHNV